MEIGGLPLHPLVVHAVVTMLPLSALGTLWFALMPRWRWLTRWPAAVLAVGGAAAAWVARLSGQALLQDRPALLQAEPLRDRVLRHVELGDLLSWVALPYAAVVLLAAWSLAGTTALASGRGAQRSRLPALEKLLPPLLVLGAVGVLVLVILTGDSGARAVWTL